MRTMTMFLMCFLLWGCRSEIPEADLHLLNGYWEIASVTTGDGSSREYPGSTTIDYLQLQGKAGFRKKVQPRLDGTYATSDDALKFRIGGGPKGWFLAFQGAEGGWEEQLVALEANAFELRNPQGHIYRYKRYEPLNLEL